MTVALVSYHSHTQLTVTDGIIYFFSTSLESTLNHTYSDNRPTVLGALQDRPCHCHLPSCTICSMIAIPEPPPKAELPVLTLHNNVQPEDVDATAVVSQWLHSMNNLLTTRDLSLLPNLFIEDSWWRDFLALSWDTRTKRGLPSIEQYLVTSTSWLSNLAVIHDGGLRPTLMNMGNIWVQAGFTFSTRYGTGRGCVHLAHTSDSKWKAWMVFTKLEKLLPDQSTNGLTNGHATSTSPQVNGHATPSPDLDTTILIVGAGVSGLTLAAQLQHRKIPYILLDKHPRVGDSWRNRYACLKTHTPNYVDTLPFMDQPEGYSRWPGKDESADWLEGYASALGLGVRTETEVLSVVRPEEGLGSEGVYRVKVRDLRSGKHEEVKCRHVVFAAGLFSEKAIVPDFPGRAIFPGEVYHSSRFRSARDVEGVERKKFAIVGSGTSAHDIAKDLVDHGAAEVTLVQRTPVFNMSLKSLENGMMAPYQMPGMRVEEADLIMLSMPVPVTRTMGVGLTQMMAAWDGEMLDKLEAKGVSIERGQGVDGFLDRLLIKASGFYVDQGANELIADEKIKWINCKGGVVDVNENGVCLADGRYLDVDVVVLATGYEKSEGIISRFFDEDVLSQIGPLGYLDDESERTAVSGVPLHF